ncbi:MAG: hypothetical protein E7G82_05790, partial [Veillonella sp.]|nr:hypothetical protein [Veillonella sp.]
LEKVVAVDGDSGASVGDRAGYKEYQLPCEGGASVFFEENWFKGEKMFAEGSRVQLVNIKLCNDAAANAIRKKKRNQRLKERLEGVAMAIGCGALFLMCLVSWDSDLTWHGIRGTFGFPYTAKEHMHDTSVYYTKTDSDSDYVYTSTLDPVSTALDLIDSVNGDINNERDNLEEGHEVIVFYSGDLVYLITNTDGQTKVKVCEQSKLTQEDWKIIDRTVISSHILDNYATIVRLRDKTGRERLYPTEGSGNTSNTKLYY